MILLTINNSNSVVSNLLPEDLKKLRRLLSYKTDPTGKFSVYNRTISLVTKEGLFPTGLLGKVKVWLKKSGLQFSQDDRRALPMELVDFTLSLPFKPRREQLHASEAIHKNHRGIIVAPTGFGKSVIAALIISKLKVSTLVVVPSLELKRQLTESMISFFGEDQVGRNKPIYVCNVDSLKNKTLTRVYNAVIIDEFHRSASNTYRELNESQWGGIYYRVGLTATPFRSQEQENIILESILDKVLYSISYQEAVNKGYIVPLTAAVVMVPKVKILESSWQAVYKRLVVENEERNDLIVKLLKLCESQGLHTLCLVKEVAHGEIISQKASVHFAHGTNEDTPILLDAFSKGKFKVLVATTGVCGEGIDTKPCEVVVICGLGKSRPAFMQQIGRALRPYPGKEDATVILFNDTSHKFVKDHFKTQCQILLEEYGVDPVLFEVE